MGIALLVARLALAAVFLLAGLTKLLDRAGTRRAIAGFDVPSGAAPSLALLLPLAELAVGLALLPRATVWWGAVGAAALLVLFIAGIAANLARGRRPDCHCFGQIFAAPIGATTLVRNLLLVTLAAFLVWQGRADAGRSAVAWLGDLSTSERAALASGLALLGLLTLEAWFLLQLAGQNGRILERLEVLEQRTGAASLVSGAVQPSAAPTVPAAGLPVGTPAPAFTLSGLYGETLTLEALRAPGRPVLLAFTDPDCGPCTALLPDLGRWQRELPATLTLSLISRGTPEANRAKSAEHGLTHVLLQQDREVHERYQVAGTPSAVLVRADGTIGSALAQGAEEIRALVARTAGGTPFIPLIPVPTPAAEANGNAHRPCPNCGQVHANGAAPPAVIGAEKVGEPAPGLALPDLDGRRLDLAGFRGSRTLVLFWNPGCGFCQQLLPDLKAWEAAPPNGAPRLLVVSAGTVEENRAQEFKAPVVLEHAFAAGYSFGVSGTPSAVLVDAAGRIASEVGVGGEAVLDLLRAGAP